MTEGAAWAAEDVWVCPLPCATGGLREKRVVATGPGCVLCMRRCMVTILGQKSVLAGCCLGNRCVRDADMKCYPSGVRYGYLYCGWRWIFEIHEIHAVTDYNSSCDCSNISGLRGCVMQGPWQVVDPRSAARMAEGTLRLGMECSIAMATALEADVLGMPL